MAEYLSKQRVKQIVEGRPQGSDPQAVIRGLLDRGYELEGLNDKTTRRNKTLSSVAGRLQMEEESRALNKPAIAARLDDSPLAALGKSVANVPSSAFNLVKGVADAALHPVRTAKGLTAIVKGGAEKLIAGVQKDEAAFDEFTNILKSRYGGLEELQLTATNDPFGFGLDVLGGIEGAAKIAGTTTTKIASKLPVLETLKPSTTIVRKLQDKAGALAVSRMDKTLNLRPTDTIRIERANVAGTKPSQWLLERDITGDRTQIVSKLTDIKTNSKASVDSGLAAIAQKYDLAGSGKRAKDALEALRETYAKVDADGIATPIAGNEALVGQIDDLLKEGSLNLSQMNNVKRLLDRNLDIFKVTGDVKSGATGKGLANIRDELKTFIEDEAAKNGFKNVKALNKETQVASEIRKAIWKRDAALQNNRTLSLTDLIVGVGAGAGIDLGTGVGVVIAKKIVEDPKVQTAIARRLNQLSKADLDVLENALVTGVPTPAASALLTRVVTEALRTIPKEDQTTLPTTTGDELQGINDGLRNPLQF